MRVARQASQATSSTLDFLSSSRITMKTLDILHSSARTTTLSPALTALVGFSGTLS